MSDFKKDLDKWIEKISPHTKFPVYFVEYPEVNEGLDLLIRIHKAWNHEPCPITKLSGKAWRGFIDLLNKPKRASKGLKEAMKAYKETKK